MASAVIADDGCWLGSLRDELRALLAPVFHQARSRLAAFGYVDALLAGPGDRCSCWQLAETAGHATPRRLQALLAEHAWDWKQALAGLQRFILDHLGDPEAILVLDETAELKKGTMTVGVARQHAGITGQVENCQTVVNCAYVTGRGHALYDFRLYLPKAWCQDTGRRQRAKVPGETTFATKTELGTQMVTAAIRARAPFAWLAGDEVYGRSAKLRAACEDAGKGYVLAVPCDFRVRLHPRRGKIRADAAARRGPAAGWEIRSCGRGCKGHRDYQWAWLATASPRHWPLLRRSIAGSSELAFFYCHAPQGRPVSLSALLAVTGKRWPVEECHQQAKGQARFDQHQVRLWHSFHRHTVLSMCALALLAAAAARPAAAPLSQATGEDAHARGQLAEAAAQPAGWADTGILPVSADDPPPAEIGMVKISVPEARRLLRLAATPMIAAARQLGYAWSAWRRKHQARARFHHYQARLRASPRVNHDQVTNRDCNTGLGPSPAWVSRSALSPECPEKHGETEVTV